jgi:hypothetical protein
MIALLGRKYPKTEIVSVSAQNTLLHALLAFKVSVEKYAVILMGLPYLYILFDFSLLQAPKFFPCSLCLLF